MASALLVRLVLITAYGWFVVAGFRTDWKWGFTNLLFPPAALAFFYLHPEHGKRPGILLLFGMLAFILTMVVFRQGTIEPRAQRDRAAGLPNPARDPNHQRHE